ncbi:MAG TPA: preprotein translocase subunit YajC [Actinomycetota bacterium]
MFELLAQDSQGGSSLVAFLPLLLMGGVFYFLLIRPQQRRARAQQALLRSVGVGDEIVTTAGVFGTIVAIDDETDVVTLEIAPGTQIRMVRAGVGRIVGDEPDDLEAFEDDERSTDVPDGQDGPFRQT